MLRPLSKLLSIVYNDLAYALVHLLHIIKDVKLAALSLSASVQQQKAAPVRHYKAAQGHPATHMEAN